MMMNNNIYNVVSSKIISEGSTDGLNKFKKLICRLFKITPEKLHWYEIELTLDRQFNGRPTDLIMAINQARWFVVSVSGNKVKVKSTQVSTIKVDGVYGQIVAFSSSYREG